MCRTTYARIKLTIHKIWWSIVTIKKILILSANPLDKAHLRLDKEASEIKKGLWQSKDRDQFKVISNESTQPADVRRALLNLEPQYVHFCGHGAGVDGIIFETEDGNSNLVDADALAGLFELFSSTTQCVVLNACYSETQALAIAKHIPYVIGMKEAIGDKAAIEFSTAFYDGLGAGKNIEFSFRLACNAIKWAGLSEDLIPKLIQYRAAIQLNRNKPSENSSQDSALLLQQLDTIKRGASSPKNNPSPSPELFELSEENISNRIRVFAIAGAIFISGSIFLALIHNSNFSSLVSYLGNRDTCEINKNATFAEYSYAAAVSAGENDWNCSVLNWKEAIKKQPNDITALANLAVRLTNSEKYQESLQYYEKVIRLGGGSGSVFAHYAHSLELVGNKNKAIDWYYRTLSVYPNADDVTEKLSSLLIDKNLPYESLTLLSGFNARIGNPNYFKANIIAIEASLNSDNMPLATEFRTAKIGQHFYMPVKFNKNGHTWGGLIDTGASYLTLSRNLLFEEKVDYQMLHDNIRLEVADGRVIDGEKVKLYKIRLGSYVLENVLAVVCDNCTLSIGQNILSQFKLETKKVKGVEFLYLSKTKG